VYIYLYTSNDEKLFLSLCRTEMVSPSATLGGPREAGGRYVEQIVELDSIRISAGK